MLYVALDWISKICCTVRKGSRELDEELCVVVWYGWCR